MWETPENTFKQAILKGFTVQGNTASRGDARITLDVAGGRVVGLFIESRTPDDLARGIGAGWGLPEENVLKLQKNLAAPDFIAEAKQGILDFSDKQGTDLIGIKATGDGADARFIGYVAVKIWPDSAFPTTKNVTGNAAAPGALRIFSDFQCPYCKQLWDSSMQDWKKKPGEYRVYHYQFPLSFHKNAAAAAEASECAGAQGKFWPYADLLFKQFDSWVPLKAADIPARFSSYAKTAGLDTNAFKTCLAKRSMKATVDTHYKAGLSVRVGGTPTVFLNGVKLTDYSDKNELAAVRAVTGAQPSAATLIDERLKLFR